MNTWTNTKSNQLPQRRNEGTPTMTETITKPKKNQSIKEGKPRGVRLIVLGIVVDTLK